jgi:hypothetical protein
MADGAVLDHLLAAGDDELLEGMAQRARQALSAGVTTVRDLGDRGGLAMRLRDPASCRSPRMRTAPRPSRPPSRRRWPPSS